MLARRRFLFLLSGGATGLWLASTGLLPLERRFVLKHAGECSFCGKTVAQMPALLGIPGATTRICYECLGMCCEIVREKIEPESFRIPEYRAGLDTLDAEFFVEEHRLRDTLREHIAMLEAQHLEADHVEHAARLQDQARREAALDEAIRAVVRLPAEPVGLPAQPVRAVEFHCSFCGAARSDVVTLVSGPRVFICDACVGDAVAIVSHVLRV